MAKVPGITSELLKKQLLELLEKIGIKSSDIMGRGTNVQRITSGRDINPFKPDMLVAMSQGKKTFSDALDVFENEAKFIMNSNDQELMNFKNNITDYISYGGSPRDKGGQGLASMMKNLETSLKDLETSAKDLKLSTEEAKDLATKQMEDALKTAQYGDPFKVPDKTSVGGTMYVEGNIRTALREFLQTELKAGKIKLDKTDTFRITEYSPMSEDDPIDVFRRHYGEDALDQVADIANVFEKGESYKHYEQLLRENVDPSVLTLKKTGAGEYDLNVKAAEDIRTKVEEGEIETIKPDDDDIPFNLGGRVGLKLGTDPARKAIIKKIKDWVNNSLKENKGVASMFKRELDDAADLDDLKFKTVLDDFVTTADEMSGAKINSNKSVQNKRELLSAIKKWNENPKHTYYRGIDKKYTNDFTKDMTDIERKHFQEAKDKEFAGHVDRGWNNFLRPGDTKKDVFTPENYGSFFSSDPYTARSYAHAKLGNLPEIKKIKLTTEEVQKGLERNFENNPFAYSEDIMLEKELADKAERDWWQGIKKKFDFAEGGRVGLKYGTKKLFSFTKKQLLDAVNDIFPTGDRKYDAEMVGDALVENNPKMFQNRLRQDLNDSEYSEIYGIALDALDAFNAEARELMKGKKGVGSLIKNVTPKDKPMFGFGDVDFNTPEIKAALDKAGQKGMALSDAMKAMGMDPSSSTQTLKFDELVSQGMEGFPREIKEQVIRAKYGDVVDQRLLDNMLVDDDPYRLAEVFATVEQGMKMQEQGMGGEEIVEAIKADIKRKPNATGGGVGSMFRGV